MWVWPLKLRNNGTVFVIIRNHMAECDHHRKSGLQHNHDLTLDQQNIYRCNNDWGSVGQFCFHHQPTLNPEEEIMLYFKPMTIIWPTPELTRSVRANNNSIFKCQALHLSSHRSVKPLRPGRCRAQNRKDQLCSSPSETPPRAFIFTFGSCPGHWRLH